MKKDFSEKLISTSLVEAFDSNTHKENRCFSCEKRSYGRGFIEPIFLYLKYSP